jgi:hypothetical protein
MGRAARDYLKIDGWMKKEKELWSLPMLTSSSFGAATCGIAGFPAGRTCGTTPVYENSPWHRPHFGNVPVAELASFAKAVGKGRCPRRGGMAAPCS